MYDDFDSDYIDRCHVCGGVDSCDELAHEIAYDAYGNDADRCQVCGEAGQCDERAHDMAADEPYAYDDEPTYNPWQDVRYAFMTTEAPF